MQLFVVDTDILTLHRDGDPWVSRRVLSHPPDELATTVISVEEFLSGWHSLIRRARKPRTLLHAYEELALTVEYLADWRILRMSEASLAHSEALLKRKLRVGIMDLRIAAIVLEHQATLVTRNEKDFQRVPGLAIENWAK
jgi:tRNA(fMet)-specific endonuclease VapC